MRPNIVASARRELNEMQSSTLPRSRMSVEGGLRQKFDTSVSTYGLGGGKLTIGLPVLKNDQQKA